MSEVLTALALLWLASKFVQSTWHKHHTTPLNGPASPSILFGVHRYLKESDDPGILYEQWAAEYGPVFRIPGGFGSSRVAVCDPKASAHFYAKDTFGYVQAGLMRVIIENIVSRCEW